MEKELKPDDRRFIQYWEDQRKGSRAGLYISYILGWSVIIFFVLFFLSRLFTNLWNTGGPWLGLVFVIIALIIAFLITHTTWLRNEKRLKRLKSEYKEELN